MKSFRTPRYLEIYKDVVFDTEQPLAVNPNDTQYTILKKVLKS